MQGSKPKPVSARVKGERGDRFIVEITYENGNRGDLEIHRDPARRFDRRFEEYAYPLVFGRHHWFDMPEEAYQQLKDLISQAIADYQKQGKGSAG